MARSGELIIQARKCNAALSDMSFDNLKHVGHSFGSFLTSAPLASYGNLSGAAVITGYIPDKHLVDTGLTSFGFELASENDPSLFGSRPSGYIVLGDASAVQTIFFSNRQKASSSFGGSKPALLEYANSIKLPGTVGEPMSFGALNLGVAPGFTGPLQYMEAECDFAICGGDCKNTYALNQLKALYPGASDVDVYLEQNTGHGLTLHRNARDGYQVTLDWPDEKGF